jgi:hypothetical protein
VRAADEIATSRVIGGRRIYNPPSMLRVLRCAIAVSIVLVLMLAGLPSADRGSNGCCCGPSAKVCPMKQRGMGAVCSISRGDSCSMSKAGGEAPAPVERPCALRAVLVEARATAFPSVARQVFLPYVLVSATFVAVPATPPPEGH